MQIEPISSEAPKEHREMCYGERSTVMALPASRASSEAEIGNILTFEDSDMTCPLQKCSAGASAYRAKRVVQDARAA